MNNPVQFNWAGYYFPDSWDLYDIIEWLNQRLIFAKQLESEKHNV